MKRSPLLRKTPIRRSGRLNPVSPKRKAQKDERAEIRDRVFARDSYRCLLWFDHNCEGGLTPHHLRKASQGGPYAVSNLVTLCAYANGLVEDEPDWTHRLGLVVRNGESLEEAWDRMHAAGLVRYGPEGL